MENLVAALQGACKNYEADLVLYYYGDSGAAERATHEQHMAQCLRCRNFVDDLGRVLARMAPKPELSQAFWDSYFRETVAKLDEQVERKSRWRSWFAPLNGWLVPAFGTAAVAVLAIALVLGKGALAPSADATSPNLPSEVVADSNQLEFFKSLEILESLSTLEEQDGGKPERKTSQLHNKQVA
jgi:anti-sigma-K factor RskA